MMELIAIVLALAFAVFIGFQLARKKPPISGEGRLSGGGRDDNDENG